VEGQEEYVPTSVLVIDDDAVMTELLKDILEQRDFQVFTAHSSNEGLDRIRKSNPEIVVLDLYLPETDGRQICRSIREFSSVPILVLSAMNNPGIVAEALDQGADDYLTKPVPGGILVAHLNNLSRRARAEREAVARSEAN
jgi:two-component system, OmpR family, KDP operon response regulator KdpE